MTKQNYRALFQPGTIGSLQLKNRLIVAPMGNALADEHGYVTEAMLDYYRVRAKGGAGLVITQFVSINEPDMMPYSLSLSNDNFLPGIKQLCGVIHENGAKAAIQLMHPGLLLLLIPSLPREMTIKIPSITPMLADDRPYQVITEDDIAGYIEDFARTAEKAVAAGADAVEIHACHGCLLSTFLSPITNQRRDRYGGSVENRTRFTREVLEAVRKRTGSDIPLIVRINASDDVPGGVTTEEVLQQAALLADAGANAISVSSGLEYWSTLMAPPYSAPEGVNVAVAGSIRKTLDIPVIAAGKINPEMAADIIEEKTADFVALGRPLLADPELPNKLKNGQVDNIRRCLYCNNCLRTAWRSCSVNPFLYREGMLPLETAPLAKRILVIGGGIAGMQAGVFLAEKGHHVNIFEKEQETGGQWIAAAAMPGKNTYRYLTDYFRRCIEELGIPVYYNTPVDRELVLKQKPDAVIIATGAKPQGLKIDGIDRNTVIQANDVILGKAKAGKRVIVIGGNMLGMEMAVMLAADNREVILVSRGKLGGRKGPDDEILYRELMRKLVNARVPLFPNVKLLEIIPDHLVVKIETEIVHLPADTIVVAIGVEPVTELADELANDGMDVYTIGDCVMPGNAAQATFSAARLASEL